MFLNNFAETFRATYVLGEVKSSDRFTSILERCNTQLAWPNTKLSQNFFEA